MNLSRPARDLPALEFQMRVKRLLAYQKHQYLDAVFLFTEVNRYYFTGLATSSGLLLTQNGLGPAFYTDFRYLTMSKRSAPWLPCRKLWRPSDEPAALGKLGSRWRRVGYEGQLDTAGFLSLKAALPKVEWIDISKPVAELRSVKSRAEQQVLRAAVAANDLLFETVLRGLTPGISEWGIRALVRREADRLGQGEAFDTIACVGKNGAECHHHPDATVLKRGQPLLLDLGLKLDHYCSDMTRCVSFGTPAPLYRDLHKIVLAANLKAVRAIKPGVPCCDIDEVARAHIAKAGYGAYFGHGLGHAVGLEIHESPSFSSACKTVLKQGMILTVEPGIYLPGKAGIRIEDMIRVTRSGCEVLSQTPRWLTA
jgi:Xaa-Pro aminopeptidase